MKPANKKFSEYTFSLSLLFIMAVYLPVNFLGFINFDDIDVINRIHDSFNNIDWARLFFRSSSSQYYRPLLEALCYLDYALWGLSVTAWHLTNYILHILNACLVYLIAKNWFHQEKDYKIWASIAMLFFALNPLTCESVAWISGRSDLAGTFFSLVAVFFYYKKTFVGYLIAPLAILAGLLCKENALAVIPLIVLLEAVQNYQNKLNFKDAIKRCLVWGLVVSIPLFIYLFLRTNGFEHYFFEYDKTLLPLIAPPGPAIEKSFISDFLVLLSVIAFYLKKLIIPFPLNFAIMGINTYLYSFLFIIISSINAICLFKKKWALPIFTLLLIISFSPALMIALGKVSWAPMAERYLYLSLSIMGIGLALLFNFLYEQKYLSNKNLLIIGTLLIAVIAIPAFFRLFAFNDSRTIWTKTLKVNPNNSMVLCKYGEAVKGKERQIAFQRAVSNPKPFRWRAKALLVLSQYEINAGNFEQGFKYIDQALKIEDNYKNYVNVASILSTIKDKEPLAHKRHIKRAVHYYKKAYNIRKTVFVLYKTASLLSHIGEIEEAKQLFDTIIQNHPQSKYAVYSKKHLEN